MPRLDLKNATIKFKDAGSEEIEVDIGEGTMSWTEHKAREYFLEKGKLGDIRDGDEAPVDVSLEFTWEWIKSATGDATIPTPVEVIKKQGAASAWVSTDADVCNPYCVDLEVINAVECTTGNKIETFTLPDFRYEELDFNLNDAKIAVSGKCHVTEVTSARTTS